MLNSGVKSVFEIPYKYWVKNAVYISPNARLDWRANVHTQRESADHSTCTLPAATASDACRRPTVSVSGGTVERSVADPAVIMTCQTPCLLCRVAVDSHVIVVYTFSPDIRRQISVLTADYCSNPTTTYTRSSNWCSLHPGPNVSRCTNYLDFTDCLYFSIYQQAGAIITDKHDNNEAFSTVKCMLFGGMCRTVLVWRNSLHLRRRSARKTIFTFSFPVTLTFWPYITIHILLVWG